MNMQRDRLEKFMVENRAAFDTAEPRTGIWDAIEAQLESNLRSRDGLEQFMHQNRGAFDTAVPATPIWEKISQQINTNTAKPELEHFITENRAAFDTQIPSHRVWTAIDKTLHPSQQRKLGVVSIMRVVRIAAAVLLLLGAGAMAGIYFSNNQIQNTNKVASLEDVSPEYAEMVEYYNSEINEKVRQVSMYSEGDPVLRDLEAIDETIKELEVELQRVPKGAEDKVILNLIKTYQIKVEILERVLNRIQQSNDTDKINSEDDEISI